MHGRWTTFAESSSVRGILASPVLEVRCSSNFRTARAKHIGLALTQQPDARVNRGKNTYLDLPRKRWRRSTASVEKLTFERWLISGNSYSRRSSAKGVIPLITYGSRYTSKRSRHA